MTLQLAPIPDGWDDPPEPERYLPAHCLCGRFARFVSFAANTMPHGEAVTTVNCSRCGTVQIR